MDSNSSKTLIIILTSGVLLLLSAVIFKEFNKKDDVVLNNNPKVVYETLNEYIENHLVTELESNSYYKVVSYKEDDKTYSALVDKNDKFIEKFNSSYNYKLYNFTYLDNIIDSKWYCEFSDDVCNLKYDSETIKENINYDSVSINNVETLKIKDLEENDKLTYTYYNIEDGKYVSSITYDYLFKLKNGDNTVNSSVIAYKSDLGFMLINLENLEPLTEYYKKIGYNYSIDTYTNLNYNYLVVVDNENQYGIIDLQGNIVVEPIYSNLNIVSDGYFSYKENNKVILFDKDNNSYDNIDYVLGNESNYIITIKDNNYLIYDNNMKEITLKTIFEDEKYTNNLHQYYSKYLSFNILPYTKDEILSNHMNLYINKYDFKPFEDIIDDNTYKYTYKGNKYNNEYIGRFIKDEEQKIYVFDVINKKIVDITSDFIIEQI